MFRKYNRLLRRFGSLLIVGSVLMTFFVGPSVAEDLKGKVSLSFTPYLGDSTGSVITDVNDFDYTANGYDYYSSYYVYFSGPTYTGGNQRGFSFSRLGLPFLASDSVASGVVQVYASFYPTVITFKNDGGSKLTYNDLILVTPGTAEFHYKNAAGGDGSTAAFPVQKFTVSSYEGIVLKSSTIASELEPISGLYFSFPKAAFWRSAKTQNGSSVSGEENNVGRTFTLSMKFTSVRVIASASTQEAEQLQGVADAIAQQNQAAQAFYGDIMGVLQAIADHQTNIDSTLGVLQEQIVTMLNKITSLDGNVSTLVALATQYLHYLESIAQTSEDILAELQSFHADFITKLDLLTSTIVTESGNVQDKMDEIYNQLIAYLDSAFADAVPDQMPGQITDTNSAIANQEQLESQWTGNMASQWQDLGITDWALAPTLISGVMWVSSWFTNVINATGDFKMILTLPMLLGIVMLIVGMISRSGGRGGSSKDHKSDSSE